MSKYRMRPYKGQWKHVLIILALIGLLWLGNQTNWFGMG